MRFLHYDQQRARTDPIIYSLAIKKKKEDAAAEKHKRDEEDRLVSISPLALQ